MEKPPCTVRPQDIDASLPDAAFAIEHVYGYNGNTVRYSAAGKVVFLAAALAVVMDPTHGDQKHYNACR